MCDLYYIEIMTLLAESIPELDGIAEAIKKLATTTEADNADESLATIEVTLPMLCRYFTLPLHLLNLFSPA